MSSPIGHSLLGASFYYFFNRGLGLHKRWKQLGLYIFASIAPDFDIIPGIMVGAINKYHHNASHSLGAAAIFAVVMALIFKWTKLSKFQIAFLIFFTLYAAHIVVDMAAVDLRPPVGVELLWPFSSNYYAFPIRFIPPVHKKDIMDIFSFDNIITGAIEIAIFLPILVLSYWYRKSNPQVKELINKRSK